MISPNLFQILLLAWFKKHGRKQLPWQHPRTPYRVWVSEIMLQQTQVTTVIPYFEKFIQTFPNIATLAQASEDSVLNLWAGLGYYARARNLHQTSKKIAQDFKEHFPNDLKQLQNLPGIGRSTAGAILSLGFNKAAPILDGNVKRLLCRLHAIQGWPGQSNVTQKLWELAEKYVPSNNACDYTQAIMDFGTLVCTKQQPHCQHCPFMQHCLAYQNQKTHEYPQAKPHQQIPIRKTYFLILMNKKQEILLEKRPPMGIWGGLWSLPECSYETDLQVWCEKNYHCVVESMIEYPTIKHTFSHFRLAMYPTLLYVQTTKDSLEDNQAQSWFKQKQWAQKGLAAPIKKILKHIFKNSINDIP